MEKLGFIGLGNMGGAICSALIDKGMDVTVFDIRKESMEKYAGKAAMAEDVLDVLKKTDIVFLSLPASKHVTPILDQYLEYGPKGKLIVDTSTSYPETTREYAKKFEEAGAALVDLTISGAPADAPKGKLMGMFGGDPKEYEHLKPYVECFADRYPNFGGSGNGNVAKLMLNFVAMSYVNIYAMCFPLADKMGLDMHQLYDVLVTTGMGCGTMKFYVPKMIDRTFDMAFALELAHKDLTYCKALFEKYQVPGFALDGELAMLRTAIRDGKGKMDYSASIDTMFEFFKDK